MVSVTASESDRARFWAKVLKDTVERVSGLGPCWIWVAALFSNGYGAFRLDGKQRRSHIVSYEWHVGPTNGLQVQHLCNVKACCRPEHLTLGTQKDNIEYAVSLGRMATGMRSGMHTQGLTTLTEVDVREIYALCLGGALQTDVATQKGVTQNMISRIMTGKAWQHLGLTPLPLREFKARPSDDIIRETRRLAAEGMIQADIADLLGMSKAAVSRIVLRQVYRDIE